MGIIVAILIILPTSVMIIDILLKIFYIQFKFWRYNRLMDRKEKKGGK